MTTDIRPWVRQADAFEMLVSLVDVNGYPLALTAENLVAQAYSQADEMIGELTIAAGDTAGDYVLSTTGAVTAGWVVGTAYTNIFDTDDESSCEQISFDVRPQISRVIPVVP